MNIELVAGNQRKILVFRLSSLGDIILSLSTLQTTAFQAGVDWVVLKEYAPLLEGNPRINRIWTFDRKLGLQGWENLCREIFREGYEWIYDLHDTIRTRFARKWFLSWGEQENQVSQWVRISKPRFSLYGQYLLKQYLPKAYQPDQFVSLFGKTVGGSGKERPDLTYLLENSEWLRGLDWSAQPYYCVMPASAWNSKCWPVENFAETIRNISLLPVILGTEKDASSARLVELLQANGIPFISGIGQWSLRQTAQVLAKSQFYFGNDTGLAHMAEAVGRPAVVLFGPTVPEMGFGPWRSESISLGKDLWCRPCGKDGRYCHRVLKRYACLKDLSVESVLQSVDWTKISSLQG